MSKDLASKRTVAVVVEQEVTRRLISHVLEEEGFVVLQVDTLNGTMSCVVPNHPDVILLDARLRNADSYALCRKLSDCPSLEGTRIIMFGSECTSTERLAGFQAGAYDFLPSPFEYGELLARIEKTWCRDSLGTGPS